MKKILIIAFIIVLAFSALACGDATPDPGQQGVVGATAVINGGPNSSGKSSGTVSPLTGMPGVIEYRPIQVQIDNESTGRPQYAIQDADVVYECMIEGADTRLSAIYNDKLPEKVGPVRSSRVYFQMIQNEWDSIYIHDGGPSTVGFNKSYVYSPENGGDMKVRIDNTKKQPDNVSWGGGALSAYANLQAAEDKFNYKRTQRNPLFKFNANPDYSKYPGFSTIGIPFLGGNGDSQVEYRYDAATDKLTRYNYGKPFLDANTQQPVTVQNVIVQYVTREELPGEGTATQATRILLGVIGSGQAEFFIGGKHMKGTWQKTDRHSGTVYKLDNGSDLVLKPGNTWIEMQPINNKTVKVS